MTALNSALGVTGSGLLTREDGARDLVDLEFPFRLLVFCCDATSSSGTPSRDFFLRHLALHVVRLGLLPSGSSLGHIKHFRGLGLPILSQ